MFSYSCFNFLRGLTYVSLWTVSARYHVYSRFFVCFDAVLSLCFVKYDLSLCAGLCATSMLKGRNNLAVISDVLFM